MSIFLSSKSEEARRQSTVETLDEPPPAYEDISRPASVLTDYTDATLTPDDIPDYDDVSIPPSVSTDTDTTLTGDTLPVAGRPFPVAFNLYYKKTSFKITTFHLGEHAEQPTNAVILNSGWRGTTLSLHQGIDAESFVLATGTTETIWSKDNLITIHALPESREEDIIEQLKTNRHFSSLTYGFSISIPTPGDKPHIEKFEWRITRGAEVRDLSAKKMGAWGWKLVRVDHIVNPNHSAPGEGREWHDRKHRSPGETSDGKEVVAVWADMFKRSRNKFGKFQFVGSGATGELGEKWAIMAVTSILRIWQNLRLGSTGGAAAASSSYAASSSAAAS